MDLVKNLFKGDKVVWVIFMFLCLISIIEVFSAASTLTYKSGDHWGPITQHCIFLMIGTVIVLIVHNIPCRWFKVLPIILLPLSAMLLFYLTAKGLLVNGAARWIEICGLKFQPSELGKMGVIIGTALILSKMQEEKTANKQAFKYILYISVPICFLIFRENGSTALLLFGVVILMMIIGRIPWKQLGKMIGILALTGSVIILSIAYIPSQTLEHVSRRLPTMQSRIRGHLEDKKAIVPAEFDIDKDAQIAHANIAIATSNVIGKMPGNSVERDFLSQAFSDFIFAIVIEELGLLGGIFVVFLYIVLLIRAGRIANKCPGNFPALLVMGITLLLVSQAILNMMVAVGLFPVTGQPLPLISKGGTSTFINCAYIGMILSVSRYAKRQEEQQKALLAGIPIEANTEYPEEENVD